MRLAITHTTRYSYDAPVGYGLEEIRLTPKSRPGQNVLDWEIRLAGAVEQATFDDQHNNRVVLARAKPGTQVIEISCEGNVETTDNAGVIGEHGGYAPLWLFQRSTSRTKAGEQIADLLAAYGNDAPSEPAALHDLSRLIGDRVAYRTNTTDAATTAEDALLAGEGVCQDHAQIFISCARKLDLPARYVSGYLMMDDRVEQEATHAWAEAYLPSLGWVGFDVSNGISPDERYVRVATGLDYHDAAPVHGLRLDNSGEAGNERLHVAIAVQQ